MYMNSNLKKVSITSLALGLLMVGYFSFTPQAQALTGLSSVQPGDLVRGETFSSVYYMGSDGMRYVFPDSNTFFTWYDGFDNVKFLSDSDLAKLQMGGNVTFRPGVHMVKINTDPKTYAVDKGGVLKHITSEAVALSLYGSDWNKNVRDVPDEFFTNYTIGDAIAVASTYNVVSVTAASPTISVDHGLSAPIVVNIGSTGFSPFDPTVSAGATVKFVNTDSIKHTATAEDLSWGTGTLNPGDTFLQTFEEEGTYGFFDSYDSGLSGAIFVE